MASSLSAVYFGRFYENWNISAIWDRRLTSWHLGWVRKWEITKNFEARTKSLWHHASFRYCWMIRINCKWFADYYNLFGRGQKLVLLEIKPPLSIWKSKKILSSYLMLAEIPREIKTANWLHGIGCKKVFPLFGIWINFLLPYYYIKKFDVRYIFRKTQVISITSLHTYDTLLSKF